MALHIKKIMDGMLIVTVLSDNFTEKISEYFYNQAKRLLCSGYNNILIDLTNVEKIDKSVIDRLYEVHKMLLASNGSMKLFGVNKEVSIIIAKSEVGSCLNVQLNEIMDIEFIDLLRFKQFTLAS